MKVFTTDSVVKDVHTIGTTDIATEAIADSLIGAEVKKAARGKKVTIKSNRNLMHRLILAYETDREDDISRVLQHELMAVPIALA